MLRRVIVAIVAIAICAPARADGQQAADRTGEISGVVTTTTEPPVPVARVLVTLSGASLKPSRTVITDERGAFSFRDLPAGSFTIVASRPPFVKTAFGATRPGRPGATIALSAGQRLTGLRIALARSAAITGVVRNPDGEPAAGIEVVATALGARTDAGAGLFATDDRGVYRIFGLTPGKYIVRASVAGSSRGFTRMTDAEIDDILARLQRRSATGARSRSAGGAASPPAAYAYAPIFYPGTADFAQAQAIPLAEGEERAGVDLDLQLIRTATLEGRVTASGEPIPADLQMSLNRTGVRVDAREVMTAGNTTRVDANGSFRFTNVAPGSYRIVARSQTMTPVAASPGTPNAPATYRMSNVRWGVADVIVAGEDLAGIALTLQPGITLRGRIVFDAHESTPPSTVSMRLIAIEGGSPLARLASGAPGGTFQFEGLLPGSYVMQSASPENGWWLRSVVIDGRDVLDAPLDLGGALQISGAVATFTDRHTELSGTVRAGSGNPAPDSFVVVFAADRTFWRAGSRRVQFTRAGADGRYALHDLPAGEYLMTALADMDALDLSDASFLESLLPAAHRVTLGDGERKAQDVVLVR